MGLILNDITHEPTNTENATQENRKRAENRDREAAVETVRPYWSAEEKAHRADESGYWRHQKSYNKWVGCFSFVAMSAAVIAAIFAGFAYRETKRQADAAEKTLELTRENFEIDERPIIGWKNSQPPQLLDGKIIWTYEFSNFGKTVANDIRFD